MAYDANKNNIFHQRCRNIAVSLLSAEEEVARLVELFTAEVQGDPAFVNTSIATTAELAALKGVMDHFVLFMAGTQAPADAARRDKLQAFMHQV